jgi:hypothetical protein
MDEAEQRLDSLCSRIIEADKAIRFVGISNKMGNQIISRYRSGLTPLLTEINVGQAQTELQAGNNTGAMMMLSNAEQILSALRGNMTIMIGGR